MKTEARFKVGDRVSYTMYDKTELATVIKVQRRSYGWCEAATGCRVPVRKYLVQPDNDPNNYGPQVMPEYWLSPVSVDSATLMAMPCSGGVQ